MVNDYLQTGLLVLITAALFFPSLTPQTSNNQNTVLEQIQGELNTIAQETAKEQTLKTTNDKLGSKVAQDKNIDDLEGQTDQIEPRLGNIQDYTQGIESVQRQTVETSSILTDAQTVFGGLQTRKFDNIIHIESDKGNTISLKRNDVIENGGGNVQKNPALYQITGTAALKTDRLTEYMAGTNAQTGIGLKVNRLPKPGENVKFGAFDEKTGYFYKINSTCTSVNLKRDGQLVESVCQENWNTNTLNGTNYTDPETGVTVNRLEYNFSAKDLNIYQWDYAWYGGGVIKHKVVMDSGVTGQDVVTTHVTDFDSNVSLQKTSLPIHVNVTDGNGSEDFQVFVGGRQHSILGDYKPAGRKTVLYRGSVTVSSSDTWEHVISFKQEEDLQDVNLDVVDISGNYGCSAEWALYRGTGANVSEPFTTDVFYNQPGETSLLVNKNSSLSFTGSPEAALNDEALLIDAGQFASGGNKNSFTRAEESIRTTVADGEVVSWFIRGSGGATCTHNSLSVTVSEDY